MVVEYLEQTKKQFIDKRESLLDEISSLEIKSKENIRMIQMLEDTNDDNFESFSPREVSSYTKSKMVELSEEQKQIQQLLQNYRSEVLELNLKIDEVTSVIKVAQNENEICNEEISKSKKSNLNVLESVEKERQRIARDLHDSTVQNLTSLVHKSEFCTKVMDKDPLRAKLELEVINNMVRNCIDELRAIIYDLRPMSFDDLGIDVTLNRVIERCKLNTDMNITYTIEGEPYQLKSVVALSIIRIIQEACNNSIKYSKGKNIKMQLIYSKNDITLIHEDDGVGLDFNKPSNITENNTGFGISSLKERVFLLGGKISFSSNNNGVGTVIKVIIPTLK